MSLSAVNERAVGLNHIRGEQRVTLARQKMRWQERRSGQVQIQPCKIYSGVKQMCDFEMKKTHFSGKNILNWNEDCVYLLDKRMGKEFNLMSSLQSASFKSLRRQYFILLK